MDDTSFVTYVIVSGLLIKIRAAFACLKPRWKQFHNIAPDQSLCAILWMIQASWHMYATVCNVHVLSNGTTLLTVLWRFCCFVFVRSNWWYVCSLVLLLRAIASASATSNCKRTLYPWRLSEWSAILHYHVKLLLVQRQIAIHIWHTIHSFSESSM